MKKVSILLVLMGIILGNVYSQVKPTIAFVGFSVKGFKPEVQAQADAVLRIELSKFNRYELLEPEDVAFKAIGKDLDLTNCYGKICLLKVGSAIGVDKMITGSIDNLGENMVISLKILDVKTEREELSSISEFLSVPQHVRTMLQISLNNMFGIDNDPLLVTKLTKKDDYDNSLNNPNKLQLRSDGPRMGMTFFTGEAASIVSSKKSSGGYDVQPYMFQFGYQFEKTYLNEGSVQALFEFIPMITGMDQGLLIPSLTILNGLRNNINGFEFAFGPTFNASKKTYGYYNTNDEWIRVNDLGSSYNKDLHPDVPNGELIHRADSRGVTVIQPGFLIAAGKTFKSGKLNIPVNGYIIPGKNGLRFGISMGFNSRSRYED
jgi:hypothetical protein